MTTMYRATPKEISALREKTGAGMMDCKAALEETGGDMEKAVDVLRKKGASKAEKRSDRTASQGLVVVSSQNGGTDVTMVELNCETDFVARTDDFIALARDLSKIEAPVGLHAGSAVDGAALRGSTVAEVVKQMSGKTGEAMAVKRVARFVQSGGTVQTYLHFNGQVGVLVEVEGPAGEPIAALAREVALHIASADPVGVNESDIPADQIARERAIAEDMVAQENKPENIRGKIVDGKIRKFVAERTLVSQPFVKDETKKVSDLVAATAREAGGSVAIKRFARFKVGEA